MGEQDYDFLFLNGTNYMVSNELVADALVQIDNALAGKAQQ